MSADEPDGQTGSGTGSGSGPADHDVGSLGEEAVRLWAALQDWAASSGAEQAGAAGSVIGGVAAGLRDIDEHLATGSAECRYCPLCRVVAAVRGTSPEVREHLALAGSSLLQAAAALLATPVPPERLPRQQPVQRIDLDDPGDGRDG